MDYSGQKQKRGFLGSRANIVLIAFLAIGAFYLLAEHRAHLWGWLPWLLLAACPLLHVFMHGSHGGHGGSGDTENGASNHPPNVPPHRH